MVKVFQPTPSFSLKESREVRDDMCMKRADRTNCWDTYKGIKYPAKLSRILFISAIYSSQMTGGGYVEFGDTFLHGIPGKNRHIDSSLYIGCEH